MEIESWAGRARRRDRTQEWLQAHRYGFRIWLVRWMMTAFDDNFVTLAR
jgi:hypothetical protein